MQRYGFTGSCPLCCKEFDELLPVQCVYEDAIVMRLRMKYQECFQKLLDVLQLHAEHGNAHAMMAELFDAGLGVPQDKQRAVELYCAAISTGASLSGGHPCFGLELEMPGYAKAAFGLALFSQEDNLTQAAIMKSMTAAPENSNPLAMQTKNLCDKIAAVYHALAQSTNSAQLFNQLLHYLPQIQYRTKVFILQDGQKEPPQIVLALIDAKVCFLRNFEASHQTTHLLLEPLLHALMYLFMPPSMSDQKISCGSVVEIHGLQSTPGHIPNGQQGKVVGCNFTTGRLAVEVQGVQGRKFIKESNLTVIKEACYEKVEIAHLLSLLTNDFPFTESREDDDLQEGFHASLQEAGTSAAGQNASLMEAILRTLPDADSTAVIKVVILEYSRNEQWFLRALVDASELQEYMNPEVPEGAKFVMKPSIFEHVLEGLREKGEKLEKRHVVVTVDMENMVKSLIEEARKSLKRSERGSFKLKGSREIDMPITPETSPDVPDVPESPEIWPVLVRRTFIDITVPSSICSFLSRQPATV